MWKENVQWLELEYDRGVPWEEVSVPDEFHARIGLKRGRGIAELDRPEKLSVDSSEPGNLVEELGGWTNILFRFQPPNLKDYDLSDTQAVKKRSKMNVREDFEDELKEIDEILIERNVETGYSCRLNTNFYNDMEELENGLSMPIHVQNNIQGVESITYHPLGEVDITQFNKQTVLIEDSFTSKLPESYQTTSFEKNIRKIIVEEDYPSRTINLEFGGSEYQLTPEEWKKVEQPVNEEKITSLSENLRDNGFQVNRYRLNEAEQPYDFRLIVTDYEEI